MKTILTTLFFFIFFSSSYSQNTIYVNQNAIGANNGSSWADAYTDLQDALPANESDTIWVAEGIYYPDVPDGNTLASFTLSNNVHLLGGFNGTETNTNQRDPLLYETILSGDLNGNDAPDDFTTNINDNVMTVVTIHPTITNATLVDGFTIRNGYADGNTLNAQTLGGGMYCRGAPMIKNCNFLHNLAESGGGLAFHNFLATGSIVENCRFQNNKVKEWTGGGGLHVLNVEGDGILVDQSIFDSNEGGRGSGLSSFDSNLKIKNSMISNNTNPYQGGGLWFASYESGTFLEVDSCTFENNHASFGGGLYFLILASNINIDINNSTVKNNQVSPNTQGWGQGGAGLCSYINENISNTTFNIDSVEFSGNNSSAGGGGFQFANLGIGTETNITNSSFLENNSDANGGGVIIRSYQDANNSSYHFDNCVFEKNSCLYNGSGLYMQLSGANDNFELTNSEILENNAAMYSAAVDLWGTAGGTGTALVDSCHFEGNESEFSGALEMGNGWNTGAEIRYTLMNSTFLNNKASEGGAVGLWSSENSQTEILVENCELNGNEGFEKGGAIGIFYVEGGVLDINVKKTIMADNESPLGGAIWHSGFGTSLTTTNNNVVIENSLLVNNISDESTIKMDTMSNLTIINSTITDNQSNAIVMANQSTLTLQNTILFNSGNVEITDLTDDGTINSQGGNLLSDNSLDVNALLTDHKDSNPLFNGAGDLCNKYQLSGESPAIGYGTPWANQSNFDLCGNERHFGARIDIGAIESLFPMTSVKDVIIENLKLSPNPATDFITIDLPENFQGDFEANIFDTQGKLVKNQIISYGGNISIQLLPTGIYSIKVVNNQEVFTGKFIKT